MLGGYCLVVGGGVIDYSIFGIPSAAVVVVWCMVLMLM
jgi:hypothetical protein